MMEGHTLAGVINNAGVAWPAPLLYQSLSDFKKVLNANLCGTFIVTKVSNQCFFSVICLGTAPLESYT